MEKLKKARKIRERSKEKTTSSEDKFDLCQNNNNFVYPIKQCKILFIN
jgi:hypothetical protein